MEHITLSELRLCQEYLYERISTVADSHMVVLKLIRNQDLRQGVHPQIIDVVFKREIFEVTESNDIGKKHFIYSVRPFVLQNPLVMTDKIYLEESFIQDT